MNSSYRCPRCHSYDIRIWNTATQIECLRCGTVSRINSFRLFGERNSKALKGLGIVLLYLFSIGFAAIIGIVGKSETRVLFTELSEYRQVQGTILSSDVVYESGGRYSRGGYTYSVSYEYSVDGHTYRSNVVHFGRRELRSYEDAQREAEQYSVGQRVIVHYLPDEPTFAALEPQIRDKTFGSARLFLIILVIMGVLASTFLLFLVIAPKAIGSTTWDDRRLR